MRRYFTLSLLLLVLALAVPLLFAETPPARRYAVLVGINHYEHPKLPTLQFAEADVTELADVLKAAGYQVTLLTGSATDDEHKPTKANIDRQGHEVLHACRTGDTVLLAFTGHGVQFEARDDKEKPDCYFCPLDARPFRNETNTLVSLSKVYSEMDASFAGMKVLLVDACRDDPEASRGINADSAPRPPQGVAALFSCRAGERSYESAKVHHGLFTNYVLKGLRGRAKDADQEVTFAGLAAYVQKQVPQAVPEVIGGEARQSPNLKADSSLDPVLLTIQEHPPEFKEAGKTATVDLGDGVEMEFVRVPHGTFLMGSPKEEVGRAADEGPQHPVQISRDFYLGKYEVTREQFRAFVRASGYKTEAERDGLGGSGYDLTLSKFRGPNWDPDTGKHTGGEKTKYSWLDAGFPQTDEHPVVNVSWNDAQAFCQWLTTTTGKTVRLPTEAEWEYACRAGTTTRFSNGNDVEKLAEVGNVADATARTRFPKWTTIQAADGYVFTAPVGQFQANRFGLCDMHGNVWEWCQDRYSQDYYQERVRVDPQGPASGASRVLRGGSWNEIPAWSRSAYRHNNGPSFRDLDVGFRVTVRVD